MNNPKISIVTVTYNAVSVLEETILSIINQIYNNIEYIVIDGGSTDGTLDIIKKYEDRLSYWISEPDKGIYDAMNKGIDRASGDWINFMNAGDLFYSNTIIQELVDMHYFDDNEAIIYGNRLVNKNGLLEAAISDLKPIKHRMDIFHQSCFVPVDLHKISFFASNIIGCEIKICQRIDGFRIAVFCYPDCLPFNIFYLQHINFAFIWF
ncbi:hypothetical protein AGMMS50239_20840 [Bacteroidia bacterium]|nr:hypothetical protein AGMMS50239_20840 [Bacteroidia bacterium]